MPIYNLPLDKARNLSVTDSDYTDAHDRGVAEGAGGGANSFVGQQNGYFYIHRLGIWFPSYNLPANTTLTGIRLKLLGYKYNQAGKDNSFVFNLQIRKTPALVDGTLEESKADYPRMLGGSLIAQEAAENFPDSSAYHYIDISLEDIDLTGTTILSLISSKDKSATEPDAGTSEKLFINATPSTTFLELTYTAIPQVTTDPATDIETTAATLNGTLDDDGGLTCTCGFQWGLTDAYGETTSTQSRTTGQRFAQGIAGLNSGSTYHFRAFATNSEGTDYGYDREFTTLGRVLFAWII